MIFYSKFHKKNLTAEIGEISAKLTVKTPERRQ